MQVNPAFKGTIEDKDINNYKEMLDKIHRNILNSQHFLPVQDRKYEAYTSPEPQASSQGANPFSSASATIAFGATSSPSPFASATSAKSGFSMPDMAMMEQFGMKNLITGV